MRHLLVTRVVAGLAVLLVAACLLFARIVTPLPVPGAGPAADGAALFESRCSACHAAADFAARWAAPADHAPADPEEVRRELVGFLAGHGHSSPAEDAAIADWLRADAAQRTGR